MSLTYLACPLCAAANPNAHLTVAPTGTWELWLVGVGLVIVVFALVMAAKMLLFPGERGLDHIKRTVLDDSAPDEECHE